MQPREIVRLVQPRAPDDDDLTALAEKLLERVQDLGPDDPAGRGHAEALASLGSEKDAARRLLLVSQVADSLGFRLEREVGETPWRLRTEEQILRPQSANEVVVVNRREEEPEAARLRITEEALKQFCATLRQEQVLWKGAPRVRRRDAERLARKVVASAAGGELQSYDPQAGTFACATSLLFLVIDVDRRDVLEIRVRTGKFRELWAELRKIGR